MRYFPTTLTGQESDALIDRIKAHFAQHGYGLWAVQVEGRARRIHGTVLGHVGSALHAGPWGRLAAGPVGLGTRLRQRSRRGRTLPRVPGRGQRYQLHRGGECRAKRSWSASVCATWTIFAIRRWQTVIPFGATCSSELIAKRGSRPQDTCSSGPALWSRGSETRHWKVLENTALSATPIAVSPGRRWRTTTTLNPTALPNPVPSVPLRGS